MKNNSGFPIERRTPAFPTGLGDFAELIYRRSTGLALALLMEGAPCGAFGQKEDK
ncbi:MAG: hypothetical protein J5472_01235 [Clostridia bacterium]|nr:hypothetical protein [Clostridia bacterium]